MMTSKTVVFTSELGSGARLIAKQLADELGVEFYGEEDLLKEAARESGIEEKVFRDYDEKLANLSMDLEKAEDGMAQKIFEAYSNTIMRIAEAGPCILMERGADIVLKGKINFLNVYTYTSDMTKKIERCVRVSGVTEEEAPSFIASQSQQRQLYYQSFSNIKRGSMNEYDLCLNTDTLTKEALDMARCTAVVRAAL
ncbi:AAA family ATPase [Oceanobacillus kapialis]|uniref:cytidylate kinase-like family protein n=1 Tax=Oceanobacillus kapialis TaxID=481353 RepID=UPI003850FB37